MVGGGGPSRVVGRDEASEVEDEAKKLVEKTEDG